MYGMSVREVRGRASLTLFIDRVIDGGPDTVTAPDDALSVRDYPIRRSPGAGVAPLHRTRVLSWTYAALAVSSTYISMTCSSCPDLAGHSQLRP